jgi:hypothetical protein
MDEQKAHRSLQLLVGELLYKNQLLREAVASKDQTINLIIDHLMAASALPCACGVGSQLVLVRDTVKLRDMDFARRRSCCFGEWGDVVPQVSEVLLSVIPNLEICPVEK